jgi:poly-gamma-glutamate synthesis protein (capsule biosynthesis protein)
VAIASIEAEAQAFTLVAVGDILLARRVGERIASAGWAAPFAAFSPILASAIWPSPTWNVQPPISAPPIRANRRSSPSGPSRSLLGLKGAGVDIVSLANNHTSDYGEEGLGET